MVSAVNTGTPCRGGIVNSPGTEAGNSYFTPDSTSTLSCRINVNESPLLIKVFAVANRTVQVLTETIVGGTSITQQLILNGHAIVLDANHTALLIDLPGYYRLNLVGGIGPIVVGEETAMSYHSYGLATFA